MNPKCWTRIASLGQDEDDAPGAETDGRTDTSCLWLWRCYWQDSCWRRCTFLFPVNNFFFLPIFFFFRSNMDRERIKTPSVYCIFIVQLQAERRYCGGRECNVIELILMKQSLCAGWKHCILYHTLDPYILSGPVYSIWCSPGPQHATWTRFFVIFTSLGLLLVCPSDWCLSSHRSRTFRGLSFTREGFVFEGAESVLCLWVVFLCFQQQVKTVAESPAEKCAFLLCWGSDENIKTSLNHFIYVYIHLEIGPWMDKSNGTPCLIKKVSQKKFLKSFKKFLMGKNFTLLGLKTSKPRG